MPLGHNRQPPEFGKIVPDNCLSGQSKWPAGFGPAVVLSLGLHALAGLLFWHGLVGGEREERAGTRIVDTRVKGPGLEVEVCLKVLDSPTASLKKGNPQLPSPSILSSPARPAINDPWKSTPEQAATRIAGASGGRGSFRAAEGGSAGASPSRTQPRPFDDALPMQSSGAHYPVGSTGSFGEGGSTTELHPFDCTFHDKREVWEEAVQCLIPMFK